MERFVDVVDFEADMGIGVQRAACPPFARCFVP
jgi:hypothetical protein